MNHAAVRPEIRLLGPMLVRRADGTVVEPSEWRTQKTLDLVRLLALSQGDPVPTQRILGQLWADVPAERARASLRTATYQVRRVLGEDVVQRRGSGLALHEVWVDTHAYVRLAEEVQVSHRTREHHDTVALAREAEALYLGDLESHDSPDCLQEATVTLRRLRHQLLLDAADAALALNWMHDAWDFGAAAHCIDPHSERATRLLMRALAGVGEIEGALAMFERLRHDLAERLGADPSPHTRAVHAALLSGTVSRPAYSMAVRHDSATASLVSALSRVRLAGTGGLVLLRGERGSGKSSVARAACAELEVAEHLPTDGEGTLSFVVERGLREAPAGSIVLLPARRSLTGPEVDDAAARARERGMVVIIPTQSTDPEISAMPILRGDAGAVVTVPRLSRDDQADLARRMFQGEPTPDLVDALHEASDGLAGVAFAVARQWLLHGRVVWTPDGLALTSAPTMSSPTGSSQVQRLLRGLDWRAIDVLSVTAVMATGALAEEVEAVLATLHPGCAVDAAAILERQGDNGLLAVTPEGYVFRSERDRALLLGWLRPALRRRLHRVVSEVPGLEPVDRARHLIACGAHQEACDVGVRHLHLACEEGDTEVASSLIGVLEQLPGRLRPDGVNRPLRHHLPAMAARVRVAWSGVTAVAVLLVTKGLSAYHSEPALAQALVAVA